MKKVTAPLTYNPGRGRPTEHLAYLNAQEMAALRRMNGDNMERGPRGLPSFPPDDAIGSSQNAGTTTTTTSSSYGTQNVQGSSLNTASGNNAYDSSSISSNGNGSTSYGTQNVQGSALNTASGNNGYNTSGIGSNNSGTTSYGTQNVAGSDLNTATGSSIDARTVAAAAVRDAVQVARQNTALRSDTGGISTINVGPMGTPVKIGDGQVRGALSRVSAPATSPAGVSAAPSYSGPYNAATNTYGGVYGGVAAPTPTITGPSGISTPPSYTGAYNPATSTYGGVVPSSSIAMDPSIAGRVALANQNYRAVTGPGGMVSGRVYSDPDIMGPTIGDTISGYASDAYGAIKSGIGSLASPFSTSAEPALAASGAAMPSLTQTPYNTSYTATAFGPQSPEYDALAAGLSPYTTGDLAMTNAMVANQMRMTPSQYSDIDRSIVESGVNLDEFGNPTDTLSKYGTFSEPKIMDRVPAERYGGLGQLDSTPTLSGTSYSAAAFGAPTVVPASDERIISTEVVPEEAPAVGPASEYFGDVYNPSDYENSLSISVPSWRQGLPSGYGDVTAPGAPSQEGASVAPSQQGLTGAQNIAVQEALDPALRAIRLGATVAGVATGLPLGIVGRGIGKLYSSSVKDKLNEYADATMQQKKEMEERDPSLVGWAPQIGVTSYHDQSYYDSWANESGMRGQGDREGGGDNIGMQAYTNPMIYADWSQGRNIPSPGDPLYNLYVDYIRTRRNLV